MSDLPLFKTTLMEENERFKARVAELEEENTELKSHAEIGWINLLGEMKHQTETSEDESFRAGWNSCIHLLDHMAFEMMGRFNVLNSLAQHDKETLTLFVSHINETGQFGWSDCQWLTDYVETYLEQLQEQE